MVDHDADGDVLLIALTCLALRTSRGLYGLLVMKSATTILGTLSQAVKNIVATLNSH